MEELPVNLGDFCLGFSISFVSGSTMGQRSELGEFGRGVLFNRDLLDKTRGSGMRDDRRAGFRTRGLLRGWCVSDDGGDGLSGEPHAGRASAVQHFVGARVDESGVEEASGGEE